MEGLCGLKGLLVQRFRTVCICAIYRLLGNCLCGLVIRVPAAYRSRGSGFDYRRYYIFAEVMSLEGGPLNLVAILFSYVNENIATAV
jgi:hypothetical protein